MMALAGGGDSPLHVTVRAQSYQAVEQYPLRHGACPLPAGRRSAISGQPRQRQGSAIIERAG